MTSKFYYFTNPFSREVNWSLIFLIGFILIHFVAVSKAFVGDTLTLQLKHKVNGKIKKIEIGSRIHLTTDDLVEYKGRLNEIQFDRIIVGKDSVLISRIKSLQIVSAGREVLGGTLIAAGIFAMLLTSMTTPVSGDSFKVEMMTLSVVSLGSGVLLVVRKGYRSKKWTITCEKD